jgi:hypothetical protein
MVNPEWLQDEHDRAMEIARDDERDAIVAWLEETVLTMEAIYRAGNAPSSIVPQDLAAVQGFAGSVTKGLRRGEHRRRDMN